MGKGKESEQGERMPSVAAVILDITVIYGGPDWG
jgi:hypothetical protein